MGILEVFNKKKRVPEGGREKTIPPHIVACKVCGGTGRIEGEVCNQCKGSGRVIVSCEVTTYVTAYDPSVE